MNKSQQSCQLCNPSSKTNKKILLIIQRLFKIFQTTFNKIQTPVMVDEKNHKQDFFAKLIDYMMLDYDVDSQKMKSSNCKKHEKLKTILANRLRISSEIVELISEKMTLQIMKGKFELSMVMHLSKNIARSKCLQKPQIQNQKKTIQKEFEQFQKNQKISQQKKKSVTSVIFNEESFKELPWQNTGCPIEEINQIREGPFDNYVTDQKIWNSYVEQSQCNLIFCPPLYYYSMQ